MHAYLLLNPNDDNIKSLAQKLESKILEFPILKIEDTRELAKLLRLHFNDKTLIVCRNIGEATEEALNAFLKNLEEPQENIYFALTAKSVSQVLPTIVSRCQIIRNNENGEPKNKNELDEFLNMKTVQKLIFFDKIKDRVVAIEFVEELLNYLHKKENFSKLEVILQTLTRLKANGNVNLQLSNLAIKL